MTARSLVLLRHAKAENPAGVADDRRPLSARGHADAQAAGAWLATRYASKRSSEASDAAGFAAPDLVLCSPTKRTRQTWGAVAANLPGTDPVVRYERRIYLGGAKDLLDLVREIEDSVSSVLVIGHNPTLSQFAFDLDPEGGLDSDGLRTCGLSVHTVDGSWSDCGPRRAPVIATHTARGDR